MDDETLKYLASLEEDLASSNDHIVPRGKRPCPICGQTMECELDQGISFDVCSHHGIWLDGHELAVIISRIRAGEHISRTDTIRKARREGKISGALFGVASLLFD